MSIPQINSRYHQVSRLFHCPAALSSSSWPAEQQHYLTLTLSKLCCSGLIPLTLNRTVVLSAHYETNQATIYSNQPLCAKCEVHRTKSCQTCSWFAGALISSQLQPKRSTIKVSRRQTISFHWTCRWRHIEWKWNHPTDVQKQRHDQQVTSLIVICTFNAVASSVAQALRKFLINFRNK